MSSTGKTDPTAVEEETEEEVEDEQKKKETKVLNDNSLEVLASDITTGLGGMVGMLGFAMYLNIPNTVVVNRKLNANETNSEANVLAKELLQYWLELRKEVKDKEKVYEMDKALRHFGKLEMADIFIDKHRANEPLTAETFVGVTYPPAEDSVTSGTTYTGSETKISSSYRS